MGKKTFKTPKKAAKAVAPMSPAPAQKRTSPTGHSPFSIFSHGKGPYSAGKTQGHTPDNTRTMPLSTHTTGNNHAKGKSPGDTLYYEDDFYTATKFSEKYNALVLAFKNLKTRTDGDYSGASHDQGHHNAAYICIEKCIHMLQEMLTIPTAHCDFDFLAKLNLAITSTETDRNLYNPLGLRPIYKDTSYLHYDWTAAANTTALQTPLTEANIRAAVPDMTVLLRIGVPLHMQAVNPPAPPPVQGSTLSFV
mgnify:CR=1 FL=1|tara:strand:- start:11230 stop:11979 length:750 start_codon:yes stop_codon:yes gene_type:complete